ncbi:hypothetical protein P5V15_010133 [Pogonomyrmex californicus]
MSNVPIFVDLQGFTVQEKFMVKEMAILKNGKELTHRIFSSRSDNLLTKTEKSKACWIISNHHGLQWSDGDVAYRLSKHVIRNGVCDQSRDAPKRVYVKGLEKKKWLEEILGCDVIADHDVIVETIDADFEDIGRLSTLDDVRAFHCERHVKHCAMENVCKLYDWWSKRRECITEL